MFADFAVKEGDASFPAGIRYDPPELVEDAVRVTYTVKTRRYRYSGELPVTGGWIPLPENLQAGEDFFAETCVEWSDGVKSLVGWGQRGFVDR